MLWGGGGGVGGAGVFLGFTPLDFPAQCPGLPIRTPVVDGFEGHPIGVRRSITTTSTVCRREALHEARRHTGLQVLGSHRRVAYRIPSRSPSLSNPYDREAAHRLQRARKTWMRERPGQDYSIRARAGEAWGFDVRVGRLLRAAGQCEAPSRRIHARLFGNVICCIPRS